MNNINFLNVWGELTREYGNSISVKELAEIVFSYRFDEQEYKNKIEILEENEHKIETVISNIKSSITNNYEYLKNHYELMQYDCPSLEEINNYNFDDLMETFYEINNIIDKLIIDVEHDAELDRNALEEIKNKSVKEVAEEKLKELERENQRLRNWIEKRQKEDKIKEEKKIKAKQKRLDKK